MSQLTRKLSNNQKLFQKLKMKTKDVEAEIESIEDADVIDEANDDEGNEAAEEDDEEAGNIDNDMDTEYGPRTQQYNLRLCKPRDYGHLHATTDGNFNATLESIAMTQHEMRKGLQVFGKAGEDAVTKNSLSLFMNGRCSSPWPT